MVSVGSFYFALLSLVGGEALLSFWTWVLYKGQLLSSMLKLP